jgi:hypothetical protein
MKKQYGQQQDNLVTTDAVSHLDGCRMERDKNRSTVSRVNARVTASSFGSFTGGT